MVELDIKKQTYYNYLEHLGIKAGKDSKGKVYLTQEQANQMRALRSHVKNGGKIEEFAVNSLMRTDDVALCSAQQAIATTGSSDVSNSSNTSSPEPEDPCAGIDEEVLFREASEVAGSRMTMGERLVLQLAKQMSYEDLHPETKAKVDAVRQAANPKFQPEVMASQLLNKWRQQRAEAAV